MTPHATFEQLRAELELFNPPSGEIRRLHWLAHTLAVARNAAGDYEIFLRGPVLHVQSSLVRRHLQHGNWRPTGDGEMFSASRIVLPSAPHFASVAALISIELLRAGIASADSPQGAFTDVEPIIEMAIRRGALPENVVIGLIGELMILRQCLLTISDKPHRRAAVLDSWCGWQNGRDFTFRFYSIEVKTTQLASSIHEFTGLHQLEETQRPSGEYEQLHLLSLGLTASAVTGESLPTIVDQLLDMLGNRHTVEFSPLQASLLERIERYGEESGTGYKHATMKDWSVYSIRYTSTFSPKLYRIADPAMRMLRRKEIEETFVLPQSLSFTMTFPDTVSAFNPALNWQGEIASMLSQL